MAFSFGQILCVLALEKSSEISWRPGDPLIGAKKSAQTLFVQSFPRSLRVILMDVRAENRGRPHQKVCFKLFDPKASGRKGQECPQEIWTKKFMFMLFFLP